MYRYYIYLEEDINFFTHTHMCTKVTDTNSGYVCIVYSI